MTIVLGVRSTFPAHACKTARPLTQHRRAVWIFRITNICEILQIVRGKHQRCGDIPVYTSVYGNACDRTVKRLRRRRPRASLQIGLPPDHPPVLLPDELLSDAHVSLGGLNAAMPHHLLQDTQTALPRTNVPERIALLGYTGAVSDYPRNRVCLLRVPAGPRLTLPTAGSTRSCNGRSSNGPGSYAARTTRGCFRGSARYWRGS